MLMDWIVHYFINYYLQRCYISQTFFSHLRKTKSNFEQLFFDGQIKTTGRSPFFDVCLALISNFFNKHEEEEWERGDDLAEKWEVRGQRLR